MIVIGVIFAICGLVLIAEVVLAIRWGYTKTGLK